MGTRSTTTIRSRWGDGNPWRINAVIYRHWDGYPEGHGQWLFDFLDGLEVINGIPSTPPPRYANGPGRVAAMIVSKLQDDGHDPLLEHASGKYGQEWNYVIDVDFGMGGGTITVGIYSGTMEVDSTGEFDPKESTEIFRGTVDEFAEFLAQDRSEDE